KRLASASADKTARLWDAASGSLEQTLTGHTGALTDLAFAPDGARLATVAADRTARLWSVPAGQTVGTLNGPGEKVACVAWAPDGKTIATAGKGPLRLWDSNGAARQA